VLWQRPLVTGADLDAGGAPLDDQRRRRPLAQPEARAGVLVVGHHRSVDLAGDVDAAMDDRIGSGFEREQLVEAGHAEDLGRCHVNRRRQMSNGARTEPPDAVVDRVEERQQLIARRPMGSDMSVDSGALDRRGDAPRQLQVHETDASLSMRTAAALNSAVPSGGRWLRS
jgi:hypothetical protein